MTSRHIEPHAKLRSAALELFTANGYEATTVEEIAARAGISRRSFFRYFSSKEDVIFPDHDTLLRVVAELLEVSRVGSPVAGVCAAMRSVFESYLTEPDVSLRRYSLTHAIPTLRDREIASVSRYQRLLTAHLAAQYGRSVEAALRAELVAAAVIAAHNHVLRRWLRRGGTGRARADLDRAFALVCATFEPSGSAVGREPQPSEEPAVVAVFHSSAPLSEIKERLLRLAE